MVQLRRESIPVDVLEEILALGEGYKTEFKATLPSPPSIAKSICAFSNTKGGNLFVGINDSSVPVGVIDSEFELDKLEKALPLLLPAPMIAVKMVTYRDCEILYIEIKEGKDKPYYVRDEHKAQAYVRSGDGNLAASRRLLRKFLNGQSGPARGGLKLRKDEKIVFNLFEQNKQLKISQIKQSLNYSERRIKAILENLARRGLLVSSDTERNVYYKAGKLHT